MCCDKIEVRLTHEASNLLGGAIWAALDLKPGFSLRVSKNAEEVGEGNQIVIEGAYPFSVPFSTVNDAVFTDFDSPVILDNATSYLECRATSASMQHPYDLIFFKGRNDKSQEWELEFRTSQNHWAYLASKKYLNTIDLGDSVFNDANITASWQRPTWQDDDPPYIMAPGDFGAWLDLSEPIQFTDPPVKIVSDEDCRYFFSLVALVKKGMCEIGWTIDGVILETELLRGAWIYILRRGFYTESKGGIHRFIGRGEAQFTFTSLVPILAYNTVFYDPGGHAPAGPPYIGVYTNDLRYRTTFKFSLKGLMTIGASPNQFGFRLMKTKDDGFPLFQWLTDETVIALAANETRYVDISFEIELAPNESAAFFATQGATFKKGYLFEVIPTQKSLMRGDTVTLKNLIHTEYTLLQLIKGMLHFMRGRTATNWASRTVTVYPERKSTVFNQIVPGFIFEENPPIDISQKVVCDSARVTPIKSNLQRYTLIAWADSTDAYIDELSPIDPFYSRKILNGLDLPDGVTELKNPFFEPTVERQPDDLKRFGDKPTPFFPVFWDNTEGELSFEIGPRILFFHGYVAQENPNKTGTADAFAAYQFEQYGTNAFLGYLAQKRTWNLVTPVVEDGNFVFGSLPGDLFVLFWLGYTQRNQRGRIYDILVFITPENFSEWDFRTQFLFKDNGREISGIATAIRDFETCSDDPAPMTLIIEPTYSQCCDQPCSCRFIECEYYQDIGQYIQQTTLDGMQVTSFEVDEIEQLAAPVDLGLIDIIEIGGRPYVRNLPDVLNKIGVPYFTFGYSDRIFTPKEELRFFKIKRPICQSFKIVISDGGGEIYRYTHDSQAQQWFGGTWSDLGYGAETFDVPENCVTTTEY